MIPERRVQFIMIDPTREICRIWKEWIQVLVQSKQFGSPSPQQLEPIWQQAIQFARNPEFGVEASIDSAEALARQIDEAAAENPVMASSLSTLSSSHAMVLMNCGRVRESLIVGKAIKRALHILAAFFGNNSQDLDLVRTMHSLALAHQQLGEFDNAIAEAEEAESLAAACQSWRYVVVCLLDRATASWHQSNGKEAILIIREARELAERENLQDQAALCLGNEGMFLADTDDWQTALQLLGQAIAAFDALEMYADAARSRLNRANACMQRDLYADAIEDYEAAATAFAQLGMVFESAGCSTGIADALRHLNRHEQALPVYLDTAEEYLALEATGKSAYCWHNASVCRTNLNQHEEALENIGRAIDLHTQANESHELAQAICTRGHALSNLGRHDESLASYRQAAEEFSALRDADQSAEATAHAAMALVQLGRPTEAIQEARQAFSFISENSVSEAGGRVHLAMGKAHEQLSRMADAERHFEQAVSAFEQSNSQLDEADSRVRLAGVLELTGRFLPGLQEFEKAERLFERTGNELGVARCQGSRGSVLLQLNRVNAALEEFARAADFFNSEAYPEQAAACQMNTGLARLQAGEYKDALEDFQRVDAHAIHGENRWRYHEGFGRALGYNGLADQAQHHFDRALAALDQVIEELGADGSQPGWQVSRQSILRHRRDCAANDPRVESAWSVLQQDSPDILDQLMLAGSKCNLKELLPAGTDTFSEARNHVADWINKHESAITDNQARAGRGSLRTLLESDPQDASDNAASADDGLMGTFRSRAAALRQNVRWPFTPDGTSGGVAGRESFRELQSALTPGWAVIDYRRLDARRIAAIVVTKSNSQILTLDLPHIAKAVGWSLRCFRLWRNGRGVPAGLALEICFETFCAPVLASLRGENIAGLYIACHDSLTLVPWEACRDKDGYLEERFAVARLETPMMLPKLPPVGVGGNAVSLVDSEPQTRPLASVVLAAIRSDTKGQIVSGPAARTALSTPQPAQCLHLACRGRTDDEFPELSRLWLGDEVLLAADILQHTELSPGTAVILEECRTSATAACRPKKAAGLIDSFLLRGAGCVLANVWNSNELCGTIMAQSVLTSLWPQVAGNPESTAAGPLAFALRKAHRQVRAMTLQESLDWCDKTLAGIGGSGKAGKNVRELASTLRLRGTRRPFDDPYYWAGFQAAGRMDVATGGV